MFLVKDNKASDSIITSLSPIAAFKILGMKPTENKKLIQMSYHKSVMELQEKETAAMKFTNMRAAYEVIIKYIENPEKPEETIDVSYLLEAIEKLACLQEIESRYDLPPFGLGKGENSGFVWWIHYKENERTIRCAG